MEMKTDFKEKILSIKNLIEKQLLKMPLWQKALIWIAITAAPCCAFWFLYLGPAINELDNIRGKVPVLEKEIASLKAKKKRLYKMQEELKGMEVVLKKALKLLPEYRDIPDILTAISSFGNEEHLDFLSFGPGPEKKVDFYAQIPVELDIVGPFHNTLKFFDKVAKMKRIVHIQNIVMGGAKEEKNIWSKSSSGMVTRAGSANQGSEIMEERDTGDLWTINTKCTAVTYRFLTKGELNAKKKAGKKKGKKKRR